MQSTKITCAQSYDSMSQVERRRAEVGNLHVVAEAVFGFQKANGIRANSIVAEQHVANAADENSRVHRILATVIFRPVGSKA